MNLWFVNIFSTFTRQKQRGKRLLVSLGAPLMVERAQWLWKWPVVVLLQSVMNCDCLSVLTDCWIHLMNCLSRSLFSFINNYLVSIIKSSGLLSCADLSSSKTSAICLKSLNTYLARVLITSTQQQLSMCRSSAAVQWLVTTTRVCTALTDIGYKVDCTQN